MDYGLTEQQREIVALTDRIGREKIKPVREHYDQTEEFPWPIYEEVKRAGLLGVYLPEAYGGAGGGTLEAVLLSEHLSQACPGISLAVTTSAPCAIPILLFGTPEQRLRWLPDLASGGRLGAFSITEPSAGSDATALRCHAKLDGDAYVLNGIKNFCSGGEAADIYVVFASTNPARGARGISAFVVEKGTAGFSFGKKEKKMGIRASPTLELVFKDCRVPKANLLYKEGFGLFVAQASFDFTRPAIAAQAVGLATGVLEETLSYIRMRRQFGQPISSFQAIQHMMADCAIGIESGRALLYATARAMDKGLNPAIDKALREDTVVYDEMKAMRIERWSMESAMSKVACSDAAMKVAVDCVQMCGGIGYMRDFPIEKFMRDAKIMQIYEGTNQIQRNEIAASMIRQSAQETPA